MTPALPEYWWRVEVDSTGEIVSCEQVEEEKRGTTRVSYVWGSSRVEAVQRARDWHKRHLRYQSESAKRLASKRRAAGQCRHCERPICPDSRYVCSEHLEKRREWNRRHRHGETTPRVPANSVKLKEEHDAHHRLYARLTEQLPELLRMYDELDGKPTAFRHWLQREIEAREERPALHLVRTR